MAGEKNEKTDVSKQYLFIKIIIFTLFTEKIIINNFPESKFNRIIYILGSFFTQFIFTRYIVIQIIQIKCISIFSIVFLDSLFYFKTSFIFYLQTNCYITFLHDFFFYAHSLCKNRPKYIYEFYNTHLYKCITLNLIQHTFNFNSQQSFTLDTCL